MVPGHKFKAGEYRENTISSLFFFHLPFYIHWFQMFSQDRNTQLQQGKYRRFRNLIYLDRFNPKHLDTTLVFDLRTLFGLLLQVFGICDEKANRINTCSAWNYWQKKRRNLPAPTKTFKHPPILKSRYFGWFLGILRFLRSAEIFPETYIVGPILGCFIKNVPLIGPLFGYFSPAKQNSGSKIVSCVLDIDNVNCQHMLTILPADRIGFNRLDPFPY